jgi:L-cysteate sulfo-lyase
MNAEKTLNLARFPRYELMEGPTPLQYLKRLSKRLDGPAIYVKRDDLMGLGGGGSKLRKLEFLLGEALASGCDTLIATGALQSNQARLAAAAAAHVGMRCELVLTKMVKRDDLDFTENGNLLLDRLFGAAIHILPGDTDAMAFARQRAEALREEGRSAYLCPLGGSSPTGCLGYVACAWELSEQCASQDLQITEIVVPNGSGGTQAGLLAGFAAMARRRPAVCAFNVLAPVEVALATTLKLANETLHLLEPAASVPAQAITINGGQFGGAYGHPTDAMREAVHLLASTEGLLTDPVYGGKAFAGLLQDIHDGRYQKGQNIVFLMTGGTPGLFAYKNAL